MSLRCCAAALWLLAALSLPGAVLREGTLDYTIEQDADEEFLLGGDATNRLAQLEELLGQRTAATKSVTLPLLEEGKVEQARDKLLLQLQRDPQNAEHWLTLIWLELKRGQPESARNKTLQALRHFPTHPELRTYLALFGAAAGKNAEAIAFLEETVAIRADLMPLLHLGNLYNAAGKHRKAVATFEKALARAPTEEGIYRALALSWIREERLPEAESVLRQALVRCKPSPAVKLLLGRIMIRMNRLEEAVDWLEQVPVDHPDRRKAVRWLSEALLLSDKIESATQVIQHWVQSHPDDNAHRYRLAICYQLQGKMTACAAELRVIIHNNPDHVPALNDLASMLAETGGDLSEALRHAQHAAELAPRNPAVLDTAGWVNHRLGKEAEALVFLEKAYGMLPDHPMVQMHLAATLAAQPRANQEMRDRARTLAEAVIKQQPGWSKHPDLQAALGRK